MAFSEHVYTFMRRFVSTASSTRAARVLLSWVSTMRPRWTSCYRRSVYFLYYLPTLLLKMQTELPSIYHLEGDSGTVCRETRLRIKRSRVLGAYNAKKRENQKRECSFHFRVASFFRFMAANLSFTQFVTLAKPLYCV